ncbi:hypothetical protein BJ138DRAFT_1017726, partial [Hygrophoropsis aurantiaca]
TTASRASSVQSKGAIAPVSNPAVKAPGTRWKNEHLPPGCQDGNLWRKSVVPSFIHWVGGQSNPWNPPEEDSTMALQYCWDAVFDGKIPHQILPNGPVAGVAMSASFYLHMTPRMRTLRLVFSSVSLTILNFLQEWTGMFKAPLILQTFAHHLNSIRGRVNVPDLESNDITHRGALAISCAAVERTLTLTYTGDMYWVLSEMDNSKGKRTKNTSEWLPIVKDGHKFADKTWGKVTRDFLDTIDTMLDDAFDEIVDAAHPYTKDGASKGKSKGSTVTSLTSDGDPGPRAMLRFR